ncbi:MAG: radical SAM protein [Deltaproteobacteria bacterium]|jgi:MoaA/NifB/PqqE/SkfB family radical SAM enzyme|nr:radical SAM protein [Deltaproteobacteria bacterium]
MHRLVKDFLINCFKSNLSKSSDLRPLVATYHLTHRCNLRCFFCEECGIEQNKKWEAEGELNTDEAKRLLRILSKRFALLYVTGGEPFLRDDALEIFREAKQLPFKIITVNTNLTLMDRVEQALPNIDNLVVSIDSIDPKRFDEIRGVKGMGERVLHNLDRAISLQDKLNFKLLVNCVVTPSTIDDARKVMNYCVERNVKVGINAQNDKHGPIKDLTQNDSFKELVREMMHIKRRTKLITGTKMYYDQMFEFIPYKCYPSLTPRINAKGDLAYPCDNLSNWVPDVISIGEWDDIIQKAREMYGPIPDCKKSCQFQCYIEPSKIAKKPWIAFKEYL